MLRSALSPQAAPSDAQLLLRFLQSRDDEAFGRLVARHADAVRRVAVRATGNPSAAEDVAQAAYIVLSRRPRAAWVSACCRGSALPWLVRTTRYAASTWRRSEGRRRRHEIAAAIPERLDPSEPGALTESLAVALSHMSRSERKLITLRHLDEKPWPDIAHALGTTPEAARKAAARALSRLRQKLEGQGIIVTPAALAIALATLARPAQSAAIAGTTTSAFVIARGVLTMMKIKTAGVAGTALIAAVMGVGVLSSGPGTSASIAAVPGVLAPSAPLGGVEDPELAMEGAEALEEQDDRPERFTPNEHQPSVTLADGTKLTLIGISNGEDGWWHANGTRARAPRHYLPSGAGFGSMSVSSSEEGSILDMAFFVQPPQREGGGDADFHARLLDVLVGQKREPESTGIAVNSKDQQQVWRIMVSTTGAEESAQAWLCIAAGEPEKVGEIRNVDDAWVADDGAQNWVTLGRDGEQIFLEPVKVGGESAAISVVAVGGDHPHGELNGQRLTFDSHALDGAQRLEIYRRPLQMVRLSNLATAPDQKTQAAMAIDETPMLLMTGEHSITHAQAGGGHVQTTVQVGGDGHRGHGAAQATTVHGDGRARAGGGAAQGTGGAATTRTSQQPQKDENPDE